MPFGISENLFKRIVSAVSLLPVVLWPIYTGGWWFAALLAVGGSLMAMEWCGLTGVRSLAAKALAVSIIGALVLFVAAYAGADAFPMLLGAVVAASVLGGLLVPLAGAAGWWLAGIGYVGMPLVALLMVRDLSAVLVLWVFLVVWATDVGGYFAGKGIGGPKLAPKISPKKTWAGLIGGMALSAAVSVGVMVVFDLPASHWLLAALLAAWAQAGDLLESAIKRHFDVKDSGGLIPGHGGLLDRVDGLVFVAPAVAGLLYVMPIFGFEFS